MLRETLSRISGTRAIPTGDHDVATSMETRIPDDADVLAGYDAVCPLYANVPPLSLWRAWEYAAYRQFCINGRVLDLGCGDGRYFRLIWPECDNVVGIDMAPAETLLAKKSGVYRTVHTVAAHQIPEADETIDHVFANCSLEHMDSLDEVLAEVVRLLKPGGTLVCSVVTDKFVEWALLPEILEKTGGEQSASRVRQEFLDYHHLSNPYPLERWLETFSRVGLIPEVHIPILPKYCSSVYLLIDNLWHLKQGDGELGESFMSFIAGNPAFSKGFRSILDGLLQMEDDRSLCAGAVFLVRKAE